MKITRKYLRQIIIEHLTKLAPPDDLSPEELDKIHRMIDAGDPDYTVQADAIMDTFGYEPGYGGSYSTDQEMYKNDPYRQMVKWGERYIESWDHGGTEAYRFARRAEREAYKLAGKFAERGFDKKKLLDIFFDTAGFDPAYRNYNIWS